MNPSNSTGANMMAPITAEHGANGVTTAATTGDNRSKEKLADLMNKARCPFRYVIGLLGVSACLLLCSTRYNLSIAIVGMVQDSCQQNPNGLCELNTAFTDPVAMQRNGTHYKHVMFTDCNLSQHKFNVNWTEEEQGIILSSYYVGFVATHVFGGRLAERYGPKWVTAVGLMGAALLNAFLPLVAEINYGMQLFTALRAIIGCFHGVVHPALFFMFKKWFPKTEQTTALSWLLIGNALGLIINVPITAMIGTIRSDSLAAIPKWSLLFYGGSALHLIWLMVWLGLVTDRPEDHRLIKDMEIFTIRQNSHNVLETNLHSVPWRRILKSKVLYASIVAKLCWSFNHAIIIDNGPWYLSKIHGFNMVEASLHIALIYMTTVIIFLLAPQLFSLLDRSFPGSHTRLRKCFQAIVFLGSVITMIAIGLARCNEKAIVILIFLNMVTQGFISVGENPMISEFAGYYSGTVYGIATTFDSVARFLAPVIRAESIRKWETVDNWNISFYITAALNVLGLVVFEMCAGTTLRNWALKKEFVRQLSSSNDGQLEEPIKKELKIELRNPYFRQDIDTETEDWIEFKTVTLVQ